MCGNEVQCLVWCWWWFLLIVSWVWSQTYNTMAYYGRVVQSCPYLPLQPLASRPVLQGSCAGCKWPPPGPRSPHYAQQACCHHCQSWWHPKLHPIWNNEPWWKSAELDSQVLHARGDFRDLRSSDDGCTTSMGGGVLPHSSDGKWVREQLAINPQTFIDHWSPVISNMSSTPSITSLCTPTNTVHVVHLHSLLLLSITLCQPQMEFFVIYVTSVLVKAIILPLIH